jgi:ribosomal protein L37AE/L43A
MDKCKHCGAEMVNNPKTGKWFCKEKCWLKQPARPLPNNDVMQVVAEQLTILAGKVDVMNSNLKALMDEITPKE